MTAVVCLVLTVVLSATLSRRAFSAEASGATTKILVFAGPCQHPPGTHEADAGARLVKHCVEHVKGVEPLAAEVLYEWPVADGVFDDVAALVFIGDIFPPERWEEPARIKGTLAKLMDRGCGIVCLHYATGLRGEHVADDGDHPLLHWLGGYFATGGCTHHRSVARVCTATVKPADGDHPVLRGWREFTFDDEPYWNIYFGKEGLAKNVTPIACSMLPPNDSKKEIVAWATSREDGGRGVGIVLPHYFRSWRIDDLRKMILNSIYWSAKVQVPTDGVESSLADLASFDPTSVDPKPRPNR
jgi:hypothetical protein